MQWFLAWWRDDAGVHQVRTRERTEALARAKIEKAIGRSVDGIRQISTGYLQHVKNNRVHYPVIE